MTKFDRLFWYGVVQNNIHLWFVLVSQTPASWWRSDQAVQRANHDQHLLPPTQHHRRPGRTLPAHRGGTWTPVLHGEWRDRFAWPMTHWSQALHQSKNTRDQRAISSLIQLNRCHGIPRNAPNNVLTVTIFNMGLDTIAAAKGKLFVTMLSMEIAFGQILYLLTI